MTSVNFTMRTSETVRPGFAIGEVWEAFLRSGFTKKTFTLPIGVNKPDPVVDLAPGRYWVQVKLSDGKLLKELVNVPEGGPVNLVLGSTIEEFVVPIDPRRSSSKFSTPEELAYAERAELAVLIPRSQVTNRSPNLGNTSGKRHRTFDSISPRDVPAELPASALRSPYIIMNRARREPGLTEAESKLAVHFNLSRLHGQFDSWIQDTAADSSVLSLSTAERYFDQLLNTRYRVKTDATTAGAQFFISLPNVDFPEQKTESLLYDRRAVYRDFVLLEDTYGRLKTLISIPRDWDEDPARVTVKDNAPGPGLSLKVSIEFNDPLSNSLVQFLRSGDATSAMEIVASSQSILHAKFEHPVAAAAAGYVLINAAPDTLKTPWQEWIGNLSRYFKEVPDAQILHATLLLQRGDPVRWENNAGPRFDDYLPISQAARIRLAATLLLGVVEKGPPIFRMGLSLMASNLSILKNSDLPDVQKKSLAKVESLVTWLSMRADPIEPFSIFHLER